MNGRIKTPAKWSSTSLEAVLFAVFAVAVTVMVIRGQSDTIRLREFINPDEGNLLAAGRRAAMSFIPFSDFTSFTYGPLWPLVLGSLHRVGMPLTLPMAHVLNAVVICGACIALAHRVWQRFNIGLAIIVVAPIALHWTKGFYSPDFYSLSTETLPFVMLVAGSAVSFTRGPISPRRAFLGAALLGSAVWSKYSFVVLVMVALVALLVRMLESGFRVQDALRTCIVAPLAPLLAVVGWALFYGVPWWKISETFAFTGDYLNGGGFGATKPGMGDRLAAVRVAVSMFRSFIPLAAVLVAALGATFYKHLAASRRGRSTPAIHTILVALLAVLSVVAALVSLAVLVPIYPHYTLLFVSGMFLATFLVASTEPVPVESHSRAIVSMAFVASVLAWWAAGPILQRDEMPLYPWSRATEATTSWGNVWTSRGALWDRVSTSGGGRLADLCPRGSKVIVWGWSPDLYSQYDWQPATRYVDMYSLVARPGISLPNAVYRDRMLADFRAEDPACVVDAANSAMFPSWGSAESIDQQMPAFAAELSSRYQRVTTYVYGSIPMTVWVRNA